MFRTCTKCKQSLPETIEFFRLRRKPNGQEYFYSVCHPCVKAERIAKYAQNPEQMREKSRRFYYENLEKERERSRLSMQKSRQNPEFRQRENERSKNWYYGNRESVKIYRAKRKEHFNALSMASYYRRRDEVLAKNRAIFPRKRFKSQMGQRWATYERNRRAAKMGAIGTHTEEDVYIQYERQNGLCYYCLKPIEEYDVDHLMPLSRGGSNYPANLVCACPSCNRSKNDKPPWEWQDFWLNVILAQKE